jgi:predicted secreted hydrolase
MNITGSLKVNNKLELVTGVSWFDHQWGDFSTINLSWDWFSLQLNDGIDLMIYQIRDNQGNPVRYEGSFTKQGETEILRSTDFVISPKTLWNSKKHQKPIQFLGIFKFPRKI